MNQTNEKDIRKEDGWLRLVNLKAQHQVRYARQFAGKLLAARNSNKWRDKLCLKVRPKRNASKRIIRKMRIRAAGVQCVKMLVALFADFICMRNCTLMQMACTKLPTPGFERRSGSWNIVTLATTVTTPDTCHRNRRIKANIFLRRSDEWTRDFHPL